MTKDEAIDFIERCDADKNDVYGYFVVAVSREDIACKSSDEVVDKFDKLSQDDQKRFVSKLANELQDHYEEYHFSEDFMDFDMFGMEKIFDVLKN